MRFSYYFSFLEAFFYFKWRVYKLKETILCDGPSVRISVFSTVFLLKYISYVFLFVCLSVQISVCSYVCLFKCLSVQMSFCSNVFLFKCLSVQMSFCSNVTLFKCHSVQMSFCSNVCMFKYQYVQMSVWYCFSKCCTLNMSSCLSDPFSFEQLWVVLIGRKLEKFKLL